MGHTTYPMGTFPSLNGEASAEITAGMGLEILADGSGVKKLTSSKAYAGVAKWDELAGRGLTAEWGIVNVQVSAAVTALDKLTCSATAGKFRTAVNAESVNGIALETIGVAGTILALMYPPGVYTALADITWAGESWGGAVATITDTSVAYVVGPKVKVTGTISAVTATPLADCADAEDHIILELYKVVSGTHTKIWAKTTAANWTDSGVALVAEVGGTVATAGDLYYLKITNETGSSISPLGVNVSMTIAE